MSTKLHPLLEEALEAHGGHERWHASKGIASTILTGGQLWELKGTPIPPIPQRVTSEFHRQSTLMTPFGDPGWTMAWTPAHLQITAGDGSVIAERQDGREAFDRSYNGQWDALNLAYFVGYAMWTYHAAPFVLAEPGYVVGDVSPVEHEGQTLRGIGVRFPEGVHSHSREQRFYFGADGLLRRHDYTVDVWADTRAAHFTSEFIDVGGLKYPTRRSVYPINADGTVNHDFNPVTIELSNYELL